MFIREVIFLLLYDCNVICFCVCNFYCIYVLDICCCLKYFCIILCIYW